MSTRHEPLGVAPDFDRGPRRAAVAAVALIAVLLVGVIVWMNFASLDVSVEATGKVVPSSRTQQIQSLEGGIVEAVLVAEGQQVRKGDVLARIQNLQFASELGEARQAALAARAAITRLTAELEGGALEFPAELMTAAPTVVAEQRALFESRLSERLSVAETLERQLMQRRQELAEARSRVRSLRGQLALAREGLAIESRLSAGNAGSRADLIAARERVAGLKGESDAAVIAVRRLQAAVGEAEARLRETDARARAEASRQRADEEQRLAALTEQLTARRDRVSRRELRAPVDGVVNRVLINTIGGIAQAGETVMELVPADDRLLISARVKPADIAFIRPGQPARVRITAYDPSVYGDLAARVLRVGADALADERQDTTYFAVTLETEVSSVVRAEQKLSISPGMGASANILTGKRTLMQYLLKPVVKTLNRALQER